MRAAITHAGTRLSSFLKSRARYRCARARGIFLTKRKGSCALPDKHPARFLASFRLFINFNQSAQRGEDSGPLPTLQTGDGMRSSQILGLFLSVGLALISGCGDSGGDAGSDAGGDRDSGGTLQVVQTAPTGLSTAAPAGIVITAEFDAPLNAATVTVSSFRLVGDGGAEVEGSVTVDGQTASFTPARGLALLSSYTATLTTEIKSASGQTLDVNHTWGFRTRDGQWGDARLLEISNAGDALSPQVDVDPSGNAIAVWEQDDGTRVNIWANRFTPAAGWGAAELIEADNAGNATMTQVAVDSSGNAIAVWGQYDGTRFNIWTSRFD